MRKAASTIESTREESRLSALFAGIAAAIDVGRYHVAARMADSARRFAPANPTAVLLHSRLLLTVGAAPSALALIRGRDEPESLALQAEAACKAGLLDEARRSCQLLLSRFAVGGVEHMAAAAARLCVADPDRFPGWLGIDSELRIVGELRSDRVATLEQDGRYLGQIEVEGAGKALGAFTVQTLRAGAGLVRVRAGPVELLGSGLSWPPDFGLCGWVVLEEHVLSGEVVLNWAPRSGVQIIVSNGSNEYRFTTDPVVRGAVGWCFSVPLDRLPPSDADVVHVCARLPDGRVAPLAGSPLSVRPHAFAPSMETFARKASAGSIRVAPAPRQVNIVVPVHSGFHETLNCLQSVAATTSSEIATITVVDDASPEPALSEALDDLARAGRITLLRNPQNLGFPGAANRGMRLHPDKDVVLLNADTEVFGRWLERLMAAAYSDDDIGTVTPLGESSSITTYSDRRDSPFSSREAAEIDRIAHRVNGHRAIEIPVGVGFCLYVRRRCLEEIGEFDEQAFGKGYGEESDFCLRARRLGWRHVAATGIFVRHAGGRSYGPAKQVLTARNSRVINYRHPGYDQLIAAFIETDPLLETRRAIDRQRLLERASSPVLLLSFDLPGGVERHVDQRQATLQASHTVLLLRSCSSEGPASRVQIRVAGADFAHLIFDLRRDLPELRSLLLELGLLRIELHHFLGLSATLLELIVGLGVPYRAFIHDYAWICPRVSLLNGAGVYCGEPAIEACEACVRTHGSAFSEPLTVAALRTRSARILHGAKQVVAPTLDVRSRLTRYFPGLAIEVTPWESLYSSPTRRQRPPRRDGRIRVALIGAIGTPKGYAVLLECARDAAARSLPLEFIVIGYTSDDRRLLETGRVFITGPYQEGEAAHLLRRERCDVALFPSQAPETWCYTLTYALAESLPIVATDFGAVAERLRTAGAGVLLPLLASPGIVNDALLQAADSEHAVNSLYKNAKRTMQPNYSSESGSSESGSSESGPATPDLAASVQVLALPVGIYAFTVTGGGAPTRNGLALPALMVAPAPIRHDGTIEFLEGPATVGRWLTRSGDVIMVKISGRDATLLLTSLRGHDSSVLSIDVRKLDLEESPVRPEGGQPDAAPAETSHLRALTVVHVQNLGDLEFTGGWAGRPAENLWIEAFSVVALAPAAADLFEYSGVAYDGAQSGWLSGGAPCGTRGIGTPLIGFAVRVKEDAGDGHSCAYTGRFLSGTVVGPCRDGSLCRSDAADDPLVAIELQFERPRLADSAVLG